MDRIGVCPGADAARGTHWRQAEQAHHMPAPTDHLADRMGSGIDRDRAEPAPAGGSASTSDVFTVVAGAHDNVARKSRNQMPADGVSVAFSR